MAIPIVGWNARLMACTNLHVAMESRRLLLPHKDPGDRFIAATALVYDLVLVTADQKLLECPKLKSL